MDDNNFGTSLNNGNNQLLATSIEDSSEFLSTIDDEEISQVQTAFSIMIDQTCSNDLNSNGNIFEHTYITQDSFAFLFRSIIPTQEIIQQDFEPELQQNLFKYQDQEGIKYAFKVFDRRTNRLIFEQMPTYHKYGMRLLFSGPVQRELLHTSAIRNFFARETLRLGKEFDEPKSRKHIPAFIKMYEIDLNELLEPNLSKYFTFNEFFYRKLKTNARPIDNRNDSNIIVSAADCRLILFDNISEATRIWIKGNQFSLRYLFDDEILAQEFHGGSIAVFRLTPADYHRFHSPIKGIIGEDIKTIMGTYYTVNPIAIRERIDVLTRNQRTMITIESNYFEKVAFVAIGALLVGSINLTVKPHQSIEKGDELGYFAYGGSTIVIVFKAGMVKWDDDLRHNSKNSMETLVRMGEHIGQRASEEESKKYLLNASQDNKKNTTISQLLCYFPTLDSLHNIKI
ncbi:unnamed protein product [Rotaria sp. Silwood2]|nr:unnamed protein product [Rotaria sp. Silwood2]CAF2757489.1 unnamed protein product [Rotaria sp. Silwood2]CAF4002189.1 unnamed protein product [Rotaria sp. Silwood2]CAF4010666.1 unnamed protein product [Rotaria sp. Silwood2]